MIIVSAKMRITLIIKISVILKEYKKIKVKIKNKINEINLL